MDDTIRKKVLTTMESFDGMTQADPKPFMLTRINAALQRGEDQSIWEAVTAFLKRPTVAIVSVLLLLILNIAVFSVSGFFRGNESISVNTVSAKYDFSVNVSGIYDSENQEP